MGSTGDIDIHAHYYPERYVQLFDAVGSDRVMLGSDYCFKMDLERPIDTLMGVPGLDDEDRERILKGTASRLLRIGAA